jgi:hypothetical protein
MHRRPEDKRPFPALRGRLNDSMWFEVSNILGVGLLGYHCPCDELLARDSTELLYRDAVLL